MTGSQLRHAPSTWAPCRAAFAWISQLYQNPANPVQWLKIGTASLWSAGENSPRPFITRLGTETQTRRHWRLTALLR